MADIHLHAGSAASVTCVSNYFIDHFLGSLSDGAVRVYLTLLRCICDPDTAFGISMAAGRLGMSAREVRTSLDELSSSGLIGLDYDSEGELCDICVKPCTGASDEVEEVRPQVSAAEETAPETEIPQETHETEEPSDSDIPAMREYSPSDKSRPEVKELLFIAQRYIGHTLSSSDLQKIMYWYDELHMSVDMIDYLLTTSIDRGVTSITYMNSIAIDWYKKGISTREQANIEQKQFSSETNVVRKAFGVTGHAFTPAEMAYIDKWFHEWGFAPEFVEEACSRTILNIGKPNYNYADAILTKWHDKGITTIDQISDDDDEHLQEIRQKYDKGLKSQPPKKNSFSFNESNNYDDAAIAAAMFKRKSF